jgi:hypothetical protein
MLAEQRDKAAAAVVHAKEVAAQQAAKEIQARAELRTGIESKMAQAENNLAAKLQNKVETSRRMSTSPSKAPRSSGPAGPDATSLAK